MNSLNRPPVIAKYNLQSLIAQSAQDYTPSEKFHNLQLWLTIYNQYNINLSYKQIRDALYRLKHYYPIKHTGRGWYRWDYNQ